MKPKTGENNFIKPRAAANILGISYQTLSKDRKNGGEIPYVKVLGSFFYEKDQLEKYIENKRVNKLK